MSIFFNYNGRFFQEGTPVITPDSRALRYGDGLFETMKMVNGSIRLKEDHFERLFHGMEMLEFDRPSHFTAAFLENEITALAKKNGHDKAARIRLMVGKGDGSLQEAPHQLPDFIIQTWHLKNSTGLNPEGLRVDVYPHARKSCDTLANIKTNNFLPYSLAAIHAQKNNLNDCLLLNHKERICDSTIANIFAINGTSLITPALSEGCIAGVMRKHIIKNSSYVNMHVEEGGLTPEALENADEVFLTNAISSLRWIKQFRKKQYACKQVQRLHTLIEQTF